MITKGPFPLTDAPGKPLPPLVAAYLELNQLKQLYRQGWLRRGIPPERCESVAEHVFSMAMLAWWVCEQDFPALDRDRVLRMTLAHELGEIYAGDLTPADAIPPAEKQRLEREGLLKVVGKLPGGAQIALLWEEYEAGETPEARFVHQVDRLEMAFQAAVYQAEGFEHMAEFFQSAQEAVTDPALRAILAQLETLRGSPRSG